MRAPRRIVVVGSGGREHALAYRLTRDEATELVLCAPGNPGMAALPRTRCVPIAPEDHAGLLALCRAEAIDLVVIGPEAPLAAGLSDALRAAGVAVFGCSQAAAEIETSKAFAKAFMVRHGIPTAAYHVLRESSDLALLRTPEAAHGWAVKADGLCAGKGVVLCADAPTAEATAASMLQGGGTVVIEELLSGREASCLAFVDGESVLPLPPCEDHKTVGEGDRGPMTGGMGVICPTPVVHGVTDLAAITESVLRPAARGMLAEGRPFQGLLFAGVMMTPAGPKVLEFNCRFGDPETQALMMLLDEPLGPLLLAVAEGRLSERGPLRFHPGASACIVVAASGYPGPPRRGDEISGLEAAQSLSPAHLQIFHAGTARTPDGTLRSAGGRVLGVTAHGPDLESARALAYAAVDRIHLDGKVLRRDIGARR